LPRINISGTVSLSPRGVTDNIFVFGTKDRGSNPLEGIGSKNFMKKIFFLFFIFSIFFPLVGLAGTYSAKDNFGVSHTVTYEGIVPCGNCVSILPGVPADVINECGGGAANPGDTTIVKNIGCQFCHLFVMISDIIKFILLTIVPPIAVLIFTIGGVSFYLAAQNPGKIKFAQQILTSATIGMLLIYCSWIIINSIFIGIGVSTWTGLENGWFQVQCPIRI
jgi:hypothetical protein